MNIADLNTYTRFLVDADSTSFTAANLLITVNNALEVLIGKILNVDGSWQYDDTNYTDLPIGTGTLVNSQDSYSFSDEYLDILWVKIKDINGDWYFLKPIDEMERDKNEFSFALETYFETDGAPRYYDKLGDTIRLYPAPDNGVTVTLSSGLKVGFQRTASLFTSAEVTTGTKVPGIASPYHTLIAYMAALPYAMNYKKDRVPIFEAKIRELTDDMLKFYSRREKDKHKVMTSTYIQFR